jgi:hypothetical protein
MHFVIQLFEVHGYVLLKKVFKPFQEIQGHETTIHVVQVRDHVLFIQVP